MAVKVSQRAKLERLCRYIYRPAVSEKRLFLTPRGDIGYQLKTPYRDGSTHVIFEVLYFIAQLAALVPPPRPNLTRFDGVFAPNSRCRAQFTLAGTRARRLKRVFRIDVETCPACGHKAGRHLLSASACCPELGAN